MRLTREVEKGSDKMTGDAEMLVIEIKETEMARLVTSTNSEFFKTTSTPVTSHPFTMACSVYYLH